MVLPHNGTYTHTNRNVILDDDEMASLALDSTLFDDARCWSARVVVVVNRTVV